MSKKRKSVGERVVTKCVINGLGVHTREEWLAKLIDREVRRAVRDAFALGGAYEWSNNSRTKEIRAELETKYGVKL